MSLDRDLRCSLSSQDRGESLAGTASVVRGFLCVEQPGAWPSTVALPGLRVPRGVKLLFIRRHGRQPARPTFRVFAVYAGPGGRWVEEGDFDDLDQVAHLDLNALRDGRSLGLAPSVGPLYLVCTHGRHDVCCAERGRPVAAALSAAFPEETWEVSHIGGDRFAGNLVLLPEGLYYGRLAPATAVEVVTADRRGELVLDLLRGRSCLPMPVQYAEIALRQWADQPRAGAVTWLRHELGELTTAWFDLEGVTYAVQVRVGRESAPRRLTCGADRDQVPPSYEVIEIRPAEA